MFIRNLFRWGAAFAVAIPLHALAASFDAKPGAWEITTTTLMQGMLIPAEALANMPPQQRAKIEKAMQARSGKPGTHVRKSCVTQQELDQDSMIGTDDEGNCKKKVVSRSATRLVLEKTCPAPQAYTAKWTIVARTPERLAATADLVQAGGGKIHIDITGRWLGTSCAGIKDGG
jgi:hypothetical protein